MKLVKAFLRIVLLPVLVVLSSAIGWSDVVVLDLTSVGASASGSADIGGTFLVNQIDQQAVGSGVWDPFVRINPGGSASSEQGYNTFNEQLDENTADNFTHPLLLVDVPIVSIGGAAYRQFGLDVNQQGNQSGSRLSLNQIQIWLTSGDPLDYSELDGSPPAISFSDGLEVFRMNPAGTLNNEIWLDAKIQPPGGGVGDMALYILDSLFVGDYTNVVLYSQFGDSPGTYRSNAGYEEWAIMAPMTVVPEPATILGLATVLLLAGWRLRRRKA